LPARTTSLAPATTASGETVLYRFKGYSRRDGQEPLGGVTGLNGALYGTTAEGGDAKSCNQANKCGTVYRVSASGREEVLYSFKGAPDGQQPLGNLLALNGLLYGTTGAGGEKNLGTVFAFDPATGAESVVYSFKGQDAGDGAYPSATLVALDGVLYGTTNQGGVSGCTFYSHGCGVIFSLTALGTEHVIHVFNANKQNREGAFPSGLTATNGLLYGGTAIGGRYSESCPQGCGILYAMKPSGRGFRSVHRFKGGNDGVGPASLIYLNGRFYGNTSGGGGYSCDAVGDGCGTIFEVSASGGEHILHHFRGGYDGNGPNRLIAVGDTLYGTTIGGGSFSCTGYGCGTAFKIKTSGAGYAVLHNFLASPDGVAPTGPLLDQNGTLYGTTSSGGRKGLGTIFELTP
jgi:uncharacterized repeat protein (TIGR03803 family)